jgi:hypothetical protein
VPWSFLDVRLILLLFRTTLLDERVSTSRCGATE